MDLIPSTNTNLPQLPASLIFDLGNLGATDTFNLDAQGYMDPTFLQSLPTTSSGVPFFPPPPDSRLNHFPNPEIHEAYRGFVRNLNRRS